MPPDYIKWIEEHTDMSVSAFLRKCVSDEIDKTDGFDAKIKLIDSQIKEKMREIESLQLQRETMQQENTRKKEEKEINEVSALIAKAINKINYVSWQDAANSLEPSRRDIPRETFLDLVQAIWFREHDGDREIVPTN
jgi:hypothetical protein